MPRDRITGSLMPWILCQVCEGTTKVTRNGLKKCPAYLGIPAEGDDCPACKEGDNPGHIYREYLA